jgi:arylsulfatase A-like enzyme
MRRLAGIVAASLWLVACQPPQPPNLVLITLDTTRPDHLGAYGHAAARTPRFDAFSAEGVLYENAYASSSWTLPSHASLFTGLSAKQHGAQAAAGGPETGLGYAVRPLADSFETLAERLSKAGYRTAAVIGGPALRSDLGVAQGFETYDEEFANALVAFNGRRAGEVANRAIAIVREFDTAPYFLFVNFFDPHAPYRPPTAKRRGIREIDHAPLTTSLVERLRSRAAGETPGELEEWQTDVTQAMRAGYDDELAFLDGHLGRLLDAIGPDAFVAITSDHGESFGEHDHLLHGAHLYEDNVRVPLVVRYPDGRNAGTRITAPIPNQGLFATMLRLSGAEPGGSGRPGLEDAPANFVAEVRRSDANVRMFGAVFDRDLRAYYAPPYKLIASSTGEFQLFDLSRDHGENSDLAADDPETRDRLRDQLAEFERQNPPLFDASIRADLSPETRESLRALGYLD